MGHLGGLVLLVGRLIYFHVWGKTLELAVHAYEIKELLMLKADFVRAGTLCLHWCKPAVSLNQCGAQRARSSLVMFSQFQMS